MSEHTDAARLEATRDAIRTGTAPRPRVEGEAAWLTMDEHEAQGYDLPKRAVGSKSHWLAMAGRWTVEAKAQRAERARLTAEVERLRAAINSVQVSATVHRDYYHNRCEFEQAGRIEVSILQPLRAALSLPAPEAT